MLTGPVVWTNLETEPFAPAGWFGPPEPWFAPSPVPAGRNLWPDELPFTAFGQFGPGALDLRVFDQDVYWVDGVGNPHRIDDMSSDYVDNVVSMLAGRADTFHKASMLREAVQCVGDALLGRVNSLLLVDELGTGSLDQVEAHAWLNSTPLLRRLRRPHTNH